MEKKKFTSSVVSALLCLVLSAAVALTMTSCGSDKGASSSAASNASSAPASSSVSSKAGDANVVGEGSTKFKFVVTDADKKSTEFTVNTDETTVGAALLKVGLIAGQDSSYGLFVTTVNGVTLDYNTDGSYWAFYIDGDYASTGVDSTEITAGATYSFVATVAEG